MAKDWSRLHTGFSCHDITQAQTLEILGMEDSFLVIERNFSLLSLGYNLIVLTGMTEQRKSVTALGYIVVTFIPGNILH